MNGLTDCKAYSLADCWAEFPVRLRRLRYPWVEQSSSDLHRRDEGRSEILDSTVLDGNASGRKRERVRARARKAEGATGGYG
jgi:hypothetical protein